MDTVSEASAERVVELVEAALTRDPAERAAFLAAACADDGTLRREVESLLGFQPQVEGFLETPAFALDVGAVAAGEGGGELSAGEILGDCKILSLLGEGGMGEVYLAEDTALGRRVALKLIRRGVGGETIIRRFQHERRVLAGLNHPHIARLYGGAVTFDGRPYLVMEFVEGERLDHYCNRHLLPVAARLALFRKVCSAVAYAHQNLVIHRDLKPGNILVTADGEPKLLDFGIAKLLDPDATQQAEATLTMFAALTPGYASPEQLLGDAITTASDTYSLGVVLYELLTGQRPHAATGLRPADLARALDGPATTRPSAAVARAAAPACGESPSRLSRRLRGDLDNIVLMAMRREPARRYASVSQFSEDIRRHCDGQPVVARRDTVGYRAGKFVQRNKTAVAAAVLLFLSLLTGVVATSREAARANRRFEDVRRLATSILFEVDPLMANLPGSMTARTALVHHALEYLDSLSQEAGSDRDLGRELATAYEKVGDMQGNPNSANVGDMKGALASYAKARELRQALVKAHPQDGRQRHELADNYEHTGYVLWWMNQTDRAVAEYHAALALRTALLAEQPRSADYRRGMALLEMHLGDVPAWNNDTPAAMAAFNVALPLLRDLAAEQPGDAGAQVAVARCLTSMGDTLKDTDQFDAALDKLAQAQAIAEPIVRRDPNDAAAGSAVWYIVFKRCELLLQQGAYDKAAAICPQMVSLAEDMVRRDPKDNSSRHKLANSHDYYGAACIRVGRCEDAIAEYAKALEVDRALTEQSPENTDFKRACADHRLGIGRAQMGLHRVDAACDNLQAARDDLERLVATNPSDLMIRRDMADNYQQLGRVHVAQGRPTEARAAYKQCIDAWQMVAASSPLNKGDADVLAEVRGELAAVR